MFIYLQFEVYAEDQGIPEKSATKQVTIQVTRDEYAPEFQGGPYTATPQPENKPVGQQVFQPRGRDRDQKVKYCEISFSNCYLDDLLCTYVVIV